MIACASAAEMTRPIDDGPIVRVPLFSLEIAVTRRGRISSPPLATVEATSAIWSGVTNVSAWPYDALAELDVVAEAARLLAVAVR